MANFKIMSFGEIVWDVYSDGKVLGGAPLNFAYYCARFGADVKLVSAIGNDKYGREAFDIMKKNHIPAASVHVSSEYPTGIVKVDISESKAPSFVIEKPSAWDAIDAGDAEFKFASSCDAFAFGTLAQRSEKSRETLYRLLDFCPPRCIKLLDVNLRQNFYSKDIVLGSLKRATALKLSGEELPIVAKMCGFAGTQRSMMKDIFNKFRLEYLVVTRGEEGHVVLGKDFVISADAKKAKVVDTVGAGDAFNAAFLTKYLSLESLQRASEFAAEVATETITHRGTFVQ